MDQNTTSSAEGSSSISCDINLKSCDKNLEKFYTYFYLLLFIPGLILNITALWVLCIHINKNTKAVIFMINLALADLAHILSLPLRIYYYFTHHWPFGKAVCLLCFYLKYFNMYAAIVFLMFISMQRYVFLLKPFFARRWRRRYDVMISIAVWLVVGVACSPFILMRSSSSTTDAHNVSSPSYSLNVTQCLPAPTKQSLQTLTATFNASESTCFKDLPIRKVSFKLAFTLMIFNELCGFVIPLLCIGYCSIRIAWSLNHSQTQDQQNVASLGPSRCRRLQSVTSNGQGDKSQEKNVNSEKRRALRMVLGCSALFLFCFAPYHINFLLYLLVSQDVVTHCATRLAVKQFHPVSLCLASLSCCLNPLLYYFLNAEFRMHLKRTSSFSSSFVSSPVTSPTDGQTQNRLLRMESTCSEI